MYHYQPTKNYLFSNESGLHVSFGIDVTDNNDQTILSISSVSTDRKKVVDLCELCTELQLDPIHLVDVLDDTFLTDNH